MIEARKERVWELIRSLKSVRVRSQTLGKEESAFEGRSSFLAETGAGKNDAADSLGKLGKKSPGRHRSHDSRCRDDGHVGT